MYVCNSVEMWKDCTGKRHRQTVMNKRSLTQLLRHGFTMETAWTTTGMSGHSHYVYINHHGNSFETRARGSVRTLDNPIRHVEVEYPVYVRYKEQVYK